MIPLRSLVAGAIFSSCCHVLGMCTAEGDTQTHTVGSLLVSLLHVSARADPAAGSDLMTSSTHKHMAFLLEVYFLSVHVHKQEHADFSHTC